MWIRRAGVGVADDGERGATGGERSSGGRCGRLTGAADATAIGEPGVEGWKREYGLFFRGWGKSFIYPLHKKAKNPVCPSQNQIPGYILERLELRLPS